MKLVIDIPEDVYTRLFDNGIQDNEIAVDDVCEIARALRLGTALPKNHGRLIDAGECKEKMIKYGFHSPDMTATEFVEDMLTTIISADKESEEKE